MSLMFYYFKVTVYVCGDGQRSMCKSVVMGNDRNFLELTLSSEVGGHCGRRTSKNK